MCLLVVQAEGTSKQQPYRVLQKRRLTNDPPNVSYSLSFRLETGNTTVHAVGIETFPYDR